MSGEIRASLSALARPLTNELWPHNIHQFCAGARFQRGASLAQIRRFRVQTLDKQEGFYARYMLRVTAKTFETWNYLTRSFLTNKCPSPTIVTCKASHPQTCDIYFI